MSDSASTRLFAILAREAPTAIVFRRGPSKQVLLIKWHLDTDRLEYGQWFKGRIYERRCDLSPSGDLLVYFAANYKAPFFSWTAISKPPYLTALALWPKGDGWGGGGIFDHESSIRLNHRPGEDSLAHGFHLKRKMRVSLNGPYSGRGEDFPIYHSLLLRNGWNLLDRGEGSEPNRKAKVVWKFAKPAVYEKSTSDAHRLQMRIKGMGQKNDSWYWIDYVILDESGKQLFALPRTDWADCDNRGLLFAKGGKLFRLNKTNYRDYPSKGDQVLKLVADLNGLKFEEKATLHKAAVW